jgi:hypothetical protein
MMRRDLPAFEEWAWGVLLRLYVWHAPPTSDPTVMATLQAAFALPMAAYAILAMCPEGHVLEAFAAAGLPLVQRLLDYGRPFVACKALFEVVRVLGGSELERLHREPNFVALVQRLARATPGVAERLLATTGSVLSELQQQWLAVMLRHATPTTLPAANATALQWEAPRCVALGEFWLRALCALPRWSDDAVVRHLVNKLLEAVFALPGGREMTSALLRAEQNQLVHAHTHGPKSAFASLTQWMSTDASFVPSLADADAGSGKGMLQWMRGGENAMLAAPDDTAPVCTWLVFAALCLDTAAETPARAQVAVLLRANPKHTVRDAARKAHVSAERFCILRWARFAGSLAPDEPLAPLFWQLFFSLFFAPADASGQFAGPMFFRGPHAEILVYLARRLHFLALHFRTLAGDERQKAVNSTSPETSGRSTPTPASSATKAAFFARLASFYESLSHWLGDANLLTRGSMAIGTLPAHMDIPRLVGVCQSPLFESGVNAGLPAVPYLWFDLVDGWRAILPPPPAVPVTTLLTAKPVVQTPAGQHTSNSRLAPGQLPQRLAGMLAAEQSTHVAAPALSSFSQPAAAAGLFVTTPGAAAAAGAGQALLDVAVAADEHALKTADLAGRDFEYLDLVPLLHVNEPLRVEQAKMCGGKFNGDVCSGAARFVFEVQQQRLVDSVQTAATVNRAAAGRILAERVLAENVCHAVLYVQLVVQAFVRAARQFGRHESPSGSAKESGSSSGVLASMTLAPCSEATLVQDGQTLYFRLADLVNDASLAYPPSLFALTSSLRVLGPLFVCGRSEALPLLLSRLLRSPLACERLLPHFQPHAAMASADEFLALYRQVAAAAVQPAAGSQLTSILRAFDMARWAVANESHVQAAIAQLGEHLQSGVHKGGAVDSGAASVVRVYETHLQILVQHEFPRHLHATLQLLVQLATTQRLPLDTWQVVLQPLANAASSGHPLDAGLALELIAWLGSELDRQRKGGGVTKAGDEETSVGGPLYPVWGMHVPKLLELFKHLCGELLAQHVSLEQAFHVLRTLLNPFLYDLRWLEGPVKNLLLIASLLVLFLQVVSTRQRRNRRCRGEP